MKMAKRVYVGPGLTPKEALKKGRKKANSDWRGWSYNKKTGWIVFI